MRHLVTLITCLWLAAARTLQAQTAVFKAVLTGRQEVMPVASSGYGEITATLTGNQLVVEGYFEQLTGTFDATVAGGAHIHMGYAGQNGGIALTLVPTLDADLRGGTFMALTNTFTLTAEQAGQSHHE
ncbi:MAG: CHRD domain-containing protein [Chloroflexi bacterium]|nr:MAG: CHRD domain-containing protein [Chloroflexota bacterium]